MSGRAKRHHFVPKILQKQFSAGENRIWYSSRARDGRFCEPELRNVYSTFWERDYYTVLQGECRSDKVERDFYGPIDDFFGKVFKEITNAFKDGEVPVFSGESLESIRLAVYEMVKRTPEFSRKAADEQVGRELVLKCLDAVQRQGDKSVYMSLEHNLKQKHRLREIGRDLRVRSTVRKPSEEFLRLLSELEVRWVRLPSKPSFVLSSAMVYRIGNGGPNGLRNPNFELWMPVQPKLALVLVRDLNRNIPPVYEDTRDHVRKINEYAVRNCSQIASHSERLIKSLLRHS